jgi:hypothetical protein
MDWENYFTSCTLSRPYSKPWLYLPMQICPSCQRALPEINRFCTQCGRKLAGSEGSVQAAGPDEKAPDELNINILYGMVAALIVAVLFPPWETPPTQPPEFLGMHFVLSPPTPEAIVSRMLLTIELVTVTIAGLYGAFLFRKK